MPRKNKKQDDLDTTTTFADMNIEGFKWYDPSQKKKDDGGNKVRQKISRREYWRMVRICRISALVGYLSYRYGYSNSFGLSLARLKRTA